MKKILDNDFVLVNFDETCNAIIAAWKKPTTSETYRLTILEIIDSLSLYHATACILDIHQLGLVSTEDRKWFQDDILPMAVTRGLKRIATVTSSDVFSQVNFESVKEAASRNDVEIEMDYFDEMNAAMSWITNTAVPV